MYKITKCGDPDLIDELDRACFPADIRLDSASLHDATWWVARDAVNGQPVGYVGTLCGMLIRYGVVPEARKQKLGTRLINTAFREAVKLGQPLETYVLATNVPSIRAFMACKWVLTHATTDEYATYLHFSKGPR